MQTEKFADERIQAHLALSEAQRVLDEVPADPSRMFTGHYEPTGPIAAKRWKEAERLIEQALEYYPARLNARRVLGLRLSEATRDRIKARAFGVYFWLDASGLEDLTAAAIRWLEEARRHGEDADGEVSMALSRMYGVVKSFEAMLDAAEHALGINRALREGLQSPESIMLLVQAAEDEPDPEGALRRPGDMLRPPLPANVAAFSVSIMNRPDQHTGVYWLALVRREYWLRQEARPRSPLLLMVWGKDVQGSRLARAGYYLDPPPV